MKSQGRRSSWSYARCTNPSGSTSPSPALPALAHEALADGEGEIGDRVDVRIRLGRQADHEIELEILNALADQHFGRAQDLRLAQILVDDTAHALAARLGGDGHGAAAIAAERRRQRRRDAVGLQ